MITALEERGFIRRLAHRARAIEIVKLPESLGGEPTAGFTPRVIEGDKPKGPRPANVEPVTVDALELPVMGRIAAGVPIEAISHVSHTWPSRAPWCRARDSTMRLRCAATR